MSQLLKGRVISLLLFTLILWMAGTVGVVLYEGLHTETITLATRRVQLSFSYSASPVAFLFSVGLHILLFAFLLFAAALLLLSLKDQHAMFRLAFEFGEFAQKVWKVLLGVAAVMAFFLLVFISSS